MKVFIFLHEKPLVTETFIVNEFDILTKFGIDFRVGYLNKNRLNKRKKDFQKYNKKFIYIRRLPKGILKRIVYILSYQLKVFISHPRKYLKVFFWIIFHFKKEFLRDFFKIAKIIPTLDRFKPDLFLTRYSGNTLIFSFLASKFYSKKYGLIYYSVYPNLPYTKHINKTISFVIVKAKYIKDKYFQKHPDLPSNKVKIIPWGIDCKLFNRGKSKVDKNRLFIILVISQLVERKGIIYLLKACRLLKNQKLQFKCIIVGNGPEEKRLLKFIKDNYLKDYVEIKPAVSSCKKLKKIYSSADLFVLPSIIDAKGEVDVIPNVLLEAMSMGLPVITTKVNGMSEVITHGVNGFLVKEKDEEDLAKMIKKVMGLPEKKREEIGRKARNAVQKYFDKEKQGKKLVEFLRSQT